MKLIKNGALPFRQGLQNCCLEDIVIFSNLFGNLTFANLSSLYPLSFHFISFRPLVHLIIFYCYSVNHKYSYCFILKLQRKEESYLYLLVFHLPQQSQKKMLSQGLPENGFLTYMILSVTNLCLFISNYSHLHFKSILKTIFLAYY